MGRRLVTMLALAAGAWLVYAGWLYAIQRQVLFAGATMHAPTARLEPPAREVVIDGDGQCVRAVYLPAGTGGPAPALILFHGNAEFAHQLTGFVRPFVEAGMHALVVEYPGYAGAPGEPSIDSISAAGRAAHAWLAAHPGVDPARIVVLGRSIGTGPACALARERRAAALVMLSGYTAIADFAAEHWVPRFLVRDPWDNIACLDGYQGPVLLGHGRHDRIIPFAHSQALHAASDEAELHALECGHNDCAAEARRFITLAIGRLRTRGILPLSSAAPARVR